MRRGMRSLAMLFVVISLFITGCFNNANNKNEMAIGKDSGKRAFVSVYSTMYFRGTPNAWGTTAMTLIADNVWSISGIKTGSTSTERFKFDVKGDWSINIGLNGVMSGSDIPLEANQIYTITLNDSTKKYTITKITAPVLTLTTVSATIIKGDTTFSLPKTAIYTENGVSTTVSTIWTPELDVNTLGTKTYTTTHVTSSAVFTLTVSEKQFAKTYTQVLFRGTPNSWANTTKMVLVGDYTWQTVQTFGGASTDRFKFDIKGDWTLNFGDNQPDFIADQGATKDIYVTTAGTYTITFNDKTKVYSVVKKATSTLTPTAISAKIAKGDTTFTLPATGTYTKDGTATEVTLVWTPALDVTKVGTTTYTTTYGDATATFALTVVIPTSTLTPTAISAKIAKGDTTFTLPATGTYTKGGIATEVTLVWTPALDVTKVGTTTYTTTYEDATATFALTVVAPTLTTTATSAKIAKGDTVFTLPVTGTYTKGGVATEVTLLAWTPALDVTKVGTTTYTTTYEDATATFALTVEEPTLTIITKTAVIVVGDTFTLPAKGSYTDVTGTSSVDLTWTPALDLTKVGTTTYTAIYLGLSVEFKLTVNLKALKSTYPTMYFRGTPNSWGKTAMTLTEDYVWTIKGIQSGVTATERFKFDVYGDWKTNFGLNGVAGGADIPLTANTFYNISFNDKTKVITLTVSFDNFSSNLPIVMIDTLGGTIVDDPKIPSNMKVIYNATGGRNKYTDTPSYESRIGIEIRGSSSQQFPKKQYGLELWDSADEGVEAAMFGMPKEEDWVLQANYTDKSLMRNVLAYQVSNAIGQYAPRTKFVEVFLKTDKERYNGAYVFLEKIKRNKNRVNVAKLTPGSIDITGGYVIKVDKIKADDKFFTTNEGTIIAHEYPKPEDVTDAQVEYIKGYFNSFETAIKGSNFADATEGYAKYIDVDSFVDYFILNELFKNPDAFRISTYMHKDAKKKLRMGPIWDFDIAMGNCEYYDGASYKGWQIDNVPSVDQYQVPFWWNRLRQDPAFVAKVKARWDALKGTTLSESNILSMIDTHAATLDEAQKRNFAKWDILGKYVWPNPAPFPTTYSGEVTALKEFMKNRINWMNSNISTIAK